MLLLEGRLWQLFLHEELVEQGGGEGGGEVGGEFDGEVGVE